MTPNIWASSHETNYQIQPTHAQPMLYLVYWMPISNQTDVTPLLLCVNTQSFLPSYLHNTIYLGYSLTPQGRQTSGVCSPDNFNYANLNVYLPTEDSVTL